MKKKVLYAALIILTLPACNSGGNSTVSAYTTTTDTSGGAKAGSKTTIDTASTVLAPTEPGKEIFQARCATCHGLDGNARNNNAANLQFTRLDSLSITQTIKNGKGSMPPFKDAIADSDIAHLAIYVKSLRQ
jgi:mono/diheme cytochrome c family protein